MGRQRRQTWGRTHILEVLPVEDGLVRLAFLAREQAAGRAHDGLCHRALDARLFEVADKLAGREGDTPERELVRLEGRQTGHRGLDDDLGRRGVDIVCAL